MSEHGNEIESLVGEAQREVVSVDVEGVENPMSFVLERHLEDFLVSNWAHTDLGKKYDILAIDGELVGQQFPTDTGPIDILAQSKDGTELLVVELKRGRVSDQVVGQILRYMGYVSEFDETKKVRGVIIGTDDDQKFRRALSMTANIEFMRYEVSFKLVKGS
jgi:restriction system protein